jgi:tRNA A37 methylthiotransferase MiaB
MDQVDIKIKKDRISRLIDIQFEIGNIEATKCIGKTYEVLCDEWKNGKAKGKSSCEKAISFNCTEDIVGQFVPVKITATKNNQLKGELVK